MLPFRRRTVFSTEVGGGGGGGGVTDHGLLTGLADDDHAQYVHNSNARTVTAVHTFNPTVAGAPFTLGANALTQKVTGLNSDLLDGLEAAAFALASHTHAASDLTSGTVALARGGTNADMSATGGSGHLVKQASAGAAFTTAQLAAGDIPSALIAPAKLTAAANKRVYCWTIKSPAAGAVYGPRIPANSTVKRLGSYTDTGTVTFNIEERTTIGSAGTNILSSDQVSDTTGEETTSSFNNDTLAAGNYLVVDIASVASTPTQVTIWLEVEVD